MARNNGDGEYQVPTIDLVKQLSIAEVEREIRQLDLWIAKAQHEVQWWRYLLAGLQKYGEVQERPKFVFRAPAEWELPDDDEFAVPEENPDSKSAEPDKDLKALQARSKAPEPKRSCVDDLLDSAMEAGPIPKRTRRRHSAVPQPTKENCFPANRNRYGQVPLKVRAGEYLLTYGPQRCAVLAEHFDVSVTAIQQVMADGDDTAFERVGDGLWRLRDKARVQLCGRLAEISQLQREGKIKIEETHE